ncbi:glycosyl hydrolase [Penicillium capsulatum]|uniref:Glycosyl hydrolase n=1 Tax=Penicillium capsulatum TaxID=69766 RepID=A0A9W9IB84_9EURO|nr:glycosyl hydrolase [Penicillium capsulatum]KAJ6135841.1 glycosyl hydrolase [Penicillium capsulatum]
MRIESDEGDFARQSRTRTTQYWDEMERGTQQGLTAQVFQLTSGTNVSNAKLSWTNSDPSLERYSIQLKSDSTSFSTVANVSGNTFDNYNLDPGRYVYRVILSARQSNEANATAFTSKASEFASYNNTKPSTVGRKPDIYVKQLYYGYNYVENLCPGLHLGGSETSLCATQRHGCDQHA